MSYYSELDKPIKNFFVKHKFLPENDFEATNFLLSVHDVDKNNVLTINLKPRVRMHGKLVDHINFSKNSYIDAFCPLVWKRLNLKERLHAIVFAFDNIIQKDKSLINAKPQLVFDFSLKDCDGHQNYYNGKHYVYLSADALFNQHFSPLTVLQTLAHELYHSKQDIFDYQTRQRIKANNLRKISNNKLDEYNKSLIAHYFGSIFFSCTEFAKNNDIQNLYKATENFNKTEYDNVCYFNTIKNKKDWKLLTQLFYLLETREKGAYNKEDNFLKSIDIYFCKTFNSYKSKYLPSNAKSIAIDIMHKLNDYYGYNLTEQDLKEFTKLNDILKTATENYSFVSNNQKYFYFKYTTPDDNNFFSSPTWLCLKKLLSIHKNKAVTEKISQNFVDQCLQDRDKTINNYKLDDAKFEI